MQGDNPPSLLLWFVASCVWLALFFVLFTGLARLCAANPSQLVWRKDLRTDVLYWFITPLYQTPVAGLLLVWSATLLFSPGDQTVASYLFLRRPWLRQWPLWLQTGVLLLLADGIQYWLHRWLHGRHLWKYHAIHHSARQVDWLTAARFHPVNIVLYTTLTQVLMHLLGFAPEVFRVVLPLNTLYAALVHANLDWTFGPFKYVVASPVFHRWHHTLDTEGMEKNFAPNFAFLDVLFGTFYMPQGALPRTFGVPGAALPDGFLGQLVYPFRGMRSSREDASSV